jgi:outer membrane protein assembly factor BamB
MMSGSTTIDGRTATESVAEYCAARQFDTITFSTHSSFRKVRDMNLNKIIRWQAVLGWLASAVLGGASVLSLSAAEALDWPYWRGPAANGISVETGLVDKWDADSGENVLWKRMDCGTRSTPVVMNGKLYFLARSEPGTPREGERVVCLDAATGKDIWESRFNVWLSDVPDTRVGWSSVVGDPETGNVYALGVCGFFQCLDGTTGKTLWSKALHEEFGLLSTYGGRTNFPIICDDLVIISAVTINWGENAKPAHRFMAFDKRTGVCVWFNGTRLLPDDTTYSSPMLTVLNGEKAMVFGSGDGAIWAMQPRTGNPIWQFNFSLRGINTSPVVGGDTVFAGQSEENITGTKMGAVAAINGASRGDITKSGQLWKIEELMLGKSSPVLLDDRLYCFDDSARAFVLDAKTGKMIGRKLTLGTIMRSSPLYADGKFYIGEQNGRWTILQPDKAAGMKISARGYLPQGDEFHASAIASHGRIYWASTGGMYCLVDPKKKPGADSPKPVPQERPASEDQKPAHLQIIPAEALLQPGAKQPLKVRLFNAAGQLLKEGEAEFTVQGAGQVSAGGVYTAPADAKHVAAIVTAKVGDLTGRARFRIVPPLPWKFDFEGLNDAPLTWVGARYRHIIRNVDGNNVMVKVTTIPKGTRSRCWFGPSDLHDYTIQADVRASIANDKSPDIGLIAQGYTFFCKGETQQLELQAWESVKRVNKTVPFQWKPNTWYTMKFQVGLQGGKSVLRAKIWPSGEQEPTAWAVEAEDEMPNKTGSPGLFGNATNAEIFLDNITVVPNS